MAVPVIMPRQGQSVETCIITRWMKKKGDIVQSGELLFTYETDKASFDAEAEADGVLLDVFYNEGDDVPVLSNVAVIGNAGEVTESFRPVVSEQNIINTDLIVNANEPDFSHTQTPDYRLRISPRAKIMASGLGINISMIKGTGPNGRIITRDINDYEKLQGVNIVSSGNVSSFSDKTEYEEIKLTRVRKLIAKAMHESISTSAQLTHHLSADVRKLLAIRERVKLEMGKSSAMNITLNDMICYALIKALVKHPELNSHLLSESLRTFRKVHLGFAVDTPRGLMVPSLRNADNLSLTELSVGLKELADQCKKGSVNPDLLSASAASFTVSNLGNYGVEMFTPIINLPQIAILGVNTIIYRPADLGNGVFGIIPMIGLSLTYDHRAVDGGPATLFLKEIKNQIEKFEEK